MKEMKIKSVIVDNLPDSCSDCRMTQWSTEGKRMYCFCVVRDEMVNLIDYPNSRPHNCPLRLESDNDKLKIDVDAAMDAIIDTCDHCGWNGETCVNNECRFYEFYKDRKEKS